MFHKAHLTCAELRYPLLCLQDSLFSGGRHACAPIIPTSALHPPVVLPPQRAEVIACTLVCCMLLRFRLSRGYTVMRPASLAYTGSTLCPCYLTMCTIFFFLYNSRDRTHGDWGEDLEGREKRHQTNGRSFARKFAKGFQKWCWMTFIKNAFAKIG